MTSDTPAGFIILTSTLISDLRPLMNVLSWIRSGIASIAAARLSKARR